jgi:hypothetical protein
MRWLASLEEELGLLEQLADAAARARAVSPEREGAEGLEQALERQATLCSQLEAHRKARAAMLEEAGHRAKDLLVVVLGALPKDEHPAAVDIFKRYVDAAEATQREIDVNREYFSVALATLEDTIDAVVSGVSAGAVYDASGSSSKTKTALCVSTVT